MIFTVKPPPKNSLDSTPSFRLSNMSAGEMYWISGEDEPPM